MSSDVEQELATVRRELDEIKTRKIADLEGEVAELRQEVQSLTHTPRINEKLWFGWTRWRWMVFAYIFVSFWMAVGLWLTLDISHREDDRHEEDAIARCELTEDGRDGIRTLVVRLVETPEGVTLTPAQQQRQQEILAILDETLPEIDCMGARPVEVDN